VKKTESLRKGKFMHRGQTVADMVNEVLARQAKAHAMQTGQPQEALAAVLETEAGRKLRVLREGAYRDKRADEWQEGVAKERAAVQDTMLGLRLP
jgi:hypothetical protein